MITLTRYVWATDDYGDLLTTEKNWDSNHRMFRDNTHDGRPMQVVARFFARSWEEAKDIKDRMKDERYG